MLPFEMDVGLLVKRKKEINSNCMQEGWRPWVHTSKERRSGMDSAGMTVWVQILPTHLWPGESHCISASAHQQIWSRLGLPTAWKGKKCPFPFNRGWDVLYLPQKPSAAHFHTLSSTNQTRAFSPGQLATLVRIWLHAVPWAAWRKVETPMW